MSLLDFLTKPAQFIVNERNKNNPTMQAQAAQLATQQAIDAKKAGILSDNELQALQLKAGTETYIIIGAVLLLIVGLVLYFKFRKK